MFFWVCGHGLSGWKRRKCRWYWYEISFLQPSVMLLFSFLVFFRFMMIQTTDLTCKRCTMYLIWILCPTLAKQSCGLQSYILKINSINNYIGFLSLSRIYANVLPLLSNLRNRTQLQIETAGQVQDGEGFSQGNTCLHFCSNGKSCCSLTQCLQYFICFLVLLFEEHWLFQEMWTSTVPVNMLVTYS